MASRPSCLIIDPDRIHARNLASICRKHGFEAHAPEDIAVWTQTSTDQQSPLANFNIAFLDACLGPQLLLELSSDEELVTELFVMSAEEESAISETCIRAGISHYFCKPFSAENLSGILDDIHDEIATNSQPPSIRKAGASLDQFGLLRGSSTAMRQLFRLLRKVSPTDTTALIIGESGTGKELIAETIHRLSPRRRKNYLTLNCAALAENLIESELFGHEKGSFSGAQKQHCGFFERADGGTLFLDEVTEISTDLQAKLLRVLESGEVRRVGSVQPMKVDVRVVAASNRDPSLAVAEGRLREDLYYRLAHIVVQVPSLRERDQDIAGLACLFLSQLNDKHSTNVTLGVETLAALQNHTWPGNVRELKNTIERAYILSGDTITPDKLLLNSSKLIRAESPAAAIPVYVGRSLAECERSIILATLKTLNNDKRETARVLGIALKTLYGRLKSYTESEGHLGAKPDRQSMSG